MSPLLDIQMKGFLLHKFNFLVPFFRQRHNRKNSNIHPVHLSVMSKNKFIEDK